MFRALPTVRLVIACFVGLAANPPARAEPAPSFSREVMAVLSRAGCNAGTCHGNLNGKGGLKLSLRGQDPAADWWTLTHDERGRRWNQLSADESLLLRKPSLAVPHEGGRRLPRDSAEYEILRHWLAAGAPDDTSRAPRVVGLDIQPAETTLVDPDAALALRVTAQFADGSASDVTGLAVFESIGGSVRVTPAGRVERQQFGPANVVVRYLDYQVCVPLAFVPNRPVPALEDWPGDHPLDRHTAERLRRLRIEPAPLADDVTFLRRVYLDTLGQIPPAEVARQFLADTSADKRTRLVEHLLNRPEWAERWALVWADLLKVEEKTLDRKGVQAMHRWLREQFLHQTPLDELARQVLTAEGSTYLNPPANFYRAHRDPTARSEAVAQVFLGYRLQCARCHNHPYDTWTQDAYYSWAAVFAEVDYKILENRRRDPNDKHEFVGEQIVWHNPAAQVKNQRTRERAVAHRLEPGQSEAEPADSLGSAAAWLAGGENRAFARAQANRIWYHLLGRGLVEPVDDLRATNPPSQPALLDALTERLEADHYDLNGLARLILTSRTYQLSSQPSASGAGDGTGLAAAVIRRLSAEELLDAWAAVLDVRPKFNGYPPGLRAGEIPGFEAVRPRDQAPSPADRFLRAFGKPPRLLNCECERSVESTLDQAFQLVSGPLVDELLSAPENRLGKWLSAGQSAAEIVDELFWTALSRPPTPEELIQGVDWLERGADRRQALEDLAWGVLNSKEFLLRR